MKCPKCNEEISDGVKFCTKCGANIEEENKKKEKKKKAAEDKKRLEEIRKQEELKREKEKKEAEKKEAIRQAKEEGIELEIIDKETPEEEKSSDFKIKKEEPAEEKKPEKKKKVKIKKNIFQRIFNKIILIIVIAAIIIGGVYYLYKQEMLPEFAQKEVKEFDERLQNVITLYKETKDGNEATSENVSENWKVENTIEADDIRDLNDEVSVIVKNGKEGLIDNETGEIVLQPRYSQILLTSYYNADQTEKDSQTGIVVEDQDNYYSIDENYNIKEEVITLTKSEETGTYFFDHHCQDIYYNTDKEVCTLVKPDSEQTGLKVCTDIDIVTTEGVEAKNGDLPESFSIDFSKSTTTAKGYFDVSTGKLKINCDYSEAYEFSEGYAAVKKDSKAGLIDEEGNVVLELKFEETRSVHNKSAFVKLDGKWGIINV